jgi:hypothetical protein
MKKLTMLAWIKTIRLLFKHRFNTRKALADTDKELTKVVCKDIMNAAYEGDEIKN